MTTNKTSASAGFNVLNSTATRYVLQFTSGPHAGSYMSTYRKADWTFDVTELWALAATFTSQTQALCVSFCFMVDSVTRVVAVRGEEGH